MGHIRQRTWWLKPLLLVAALAGGVTSLACMPNTLPPIDSQAAARLGIKVYRTPNAFTLPVADTVLGYLLAFARQRKPQRIGELLQKIVGDPPVRVIGPAELSLSEELEVAQVLERKRPIGAQFGTDAGKRLGVRPLACHALYRVAGQGLHENKGDQRDAEEGRNEE